MHENIMVSYDGSRESLHALAEARQMLATNPRLRLHVVQVASDDDLGVAANTGLHGLGDYYRPLDGSATMLVRGQARERRLARLHEELDEHLADVRNEVLFSVVDQELSIAETLLGYAHENDIDLIVMGCRGLGAIRGVLGSVSYAMLRSSDIPILIAK